MRKQPCAYAWWMRSKRACSKLRLAIDGVSCGKRERERERERSEEKRREERGRTSEEERKVE